jgi:hypothetical protein
MSVSILIVEKSGIIKEHIVKSFVESELYKKAGFKTAEGFVCQTVWDIDNGDTEKSYSISVYGKTTGRAGQENKYEFPPPIDETLFFGSCVIVNKKENQAVNISAKEWETVYEYLYGGFEDIGEEDSEYDEETEEEIDETQLTKSGYIKDDFIVEDDDDEEDDEEEEEEDDDEEEYVSSKKKSVVRRTRQSAPSANAKKTKKTVKTAVIKPEIETTYLDCTSELSEEEYMA